MINSDGDFKAGKSMTWHASMHFIVTLRLLGLVGRNLYLLRTVDLCLNGGGPGDGWSLAACKKPASAVVARRLQCRPTIADIRLVALGVTAAGGNYFGEQVRIGGNTPIVAVDATCQGHRRTRLHQADRSVPGEDQPAHGGQADVLLSGPCCGGRPPGRAFVPVSARPRRTPTSRAWPPAWSTASAVRIRNGALPKGTIRTARTEGTPPQPASVRR